MRRWFLLVTLIGGLIAWTLASGLAGRVVLSAQVLDELRRPGPSSWLRRATREPVVTTTLLRSGSRQFVADVYHPKSGRFSSPLLFVPGMVEAGKDEPRVAPFAKLLARAGFLVVVPDLPSFMALRVHLDNERELSSALDAVLARRDLAPHERCGIFAVSYAGGIAVLAALDPGRAPHVPFVASVGGFADLERSLEFLATGRTMFRGRPHQVQPGLYGRLVFLRTFEEFIDDAKDRQVLELMAARRMANSSAPLGDLAARLGQRGRALYDLFETATPEQVPALIARLPQGLRACMAGLSPGRRDFSTLRAKLYLAHARDDDSFPVDESVRLAALARPHTRVRLAVLESLHHVDPAPWHQGVRGFLTRDLPEAFKLLAWWTDLLGERDRRAGR